jgi:type II secretory pathway component PulJ
MVNPGKGPGSVSSWRSDSGTTLLEVVAALGIMVMLLAVLAQLLHTGGRLWLKSDRAYQAPHQLQDLQNLLGQDLRQAYTSDFLPGQALSGDATQLVLWRETSRGLEQVTYRYDASAKILYRSAGFWGERCVEEAAFADLAAWKFEYYAAAAKRWQYNWKPERKTNLPSLIRITAATPTHDLGSQVIAVEAAGYDEADN